MYKGIFWCYKGFYEEYYFYTVKVRCDTNGTPLESIEFTSKSGDNFNHKVEWEKRGKIGKPYNYYPRGRIEIRNGKIKIYANPILIADSVVQCHIIEHFELEDEKTKIKWIPDYSTHYEYLSKD